MPIFLKENLIFLKVQKFPYVAVYNLLLYRYLTIVVVLSGWTDESDE